MLAAKGKCVREKQCNSDKCIWTSEQKEIHANYAHLSLQAVLMLPEPYIEKVEDLKAIVAVVNLKQPALKFC